MTRTAVAQPMAHTSSDVVAPALAFEEWLVGDLLCSEVRALVVSPLRFDPIHLDPEGRVTTLCCSPRGGDEASTDAERRFAGDAFDAVYLHRMVAIAMPGRWLERARQILKPGGRIIAAVDPSEFGFAPLPAGGDAQLLGRILIDAGFCRVELIHRAPDLIIVTAHRDERDRTR
jgi:hypothetical protein